MIEYQNLILSTIEDGRYKPNRTDVDTISSFNQSYEIDLQDGFPLLTTKQMNGFRWNSLIHELLWYFSGEHHIRSLREETSIWDEWADEKGHLDTSYGRFWRRFPIPPEGLAGESWVDGGDRWVNEDESTFDQLQYVIDQLRENPNSRRLVVTAWHPANAAKSTLPPCHYTFVLNVQGSRLNLHLTQRSGDLGLGVPFDIAAYALLTTVIAQRSGLEIGTFAHSIVDAHIYCGKAERGEWYRDELPALKRRLRAADQCEEYLGIKEWVAESAPAETEAGYDHVPGLLEQLSRTPRDRPTVEVTKKPLDELTFEDIELHEYEFAPGIRFSVAE